MRPHYQPIQRSPKNPPKVKRHADNWPKPCAVDAGKGMNGFMRVGSSRATRVDRRGLLHP